MSLLSDSRILLVEDEFLLATDLAQALAAQGAEVLGPIATLAEAQQMLAGEPVDCAIVDINLQGTMAFPLLAALRDEGVPALVISAYPVDVLPPEHRGVSFLAKPSPIALTLQMVELLLRGEVHERMPQDG
ncbi:response regulator [Flavisphingomonas formosensis]|uniref:response regulator n=1 Tax=Flavisphingomonas formosensis TaxID=861534 RepID=UPI0012F750E5|nr:response regulator [Sphingomonas formosensis]